MHDGTEQVLWKHTSSDWVEVCEPNRPLNEGTQSGDLPLNLTVAVPTAQQAKSTYTIVADLKDYDDFGSDDPVLHGSENVNLTDGQRGYLQDNYPDHYIRASLQYQVNATK